MPDMNDLRKLNKEIMENYDDYIVGLKEKRRKIEIAKKAFENAENIISDLDTEFYEKTGIFNSKDLSLLFVATGMLCAKWLIIKQVLPLDFDFKYEKKPKKGINLQMKSLMKVNMIIMMKTIFHQMDIVL